MGKFSGYPAHIQGEKKWSRAYALLTTSLVLLMGSAPALALPGDGTVVAGSADIQTGPGQTLITQSSDRAIINWNSFSIGNGEIVRFLQPGSGSLAVNRVTGADPSHILGTLTANGQIMLINPNGVLFGSTARVDVNSLVATTIDATDERLMNGDFRFDIVKNPSATVVNRGLITAADGGLVALVAPGVANDGIIQARLGKVALAGTHEFSVDLYGDGLISLPAGTRTVDEIYDAEGNALSEPVSNNGEIRAPGGQVVLSARTAKHMVDDVINMGGVIEARSVGTRNGVIVLDGGGGKVKVSGRMDVSGKASGEKAGAVKVAAKHIEIKETAVIDASGDIGGGEVLIGGDFQGGGDMPRATTTVVAEGSRIDASAITEGDGGKVVVWSDDQTRFGGEILSRGGAIGGNGGVIETSGRGKLSVLAQAFADASAPNGNAGLWLLDPSDVYLRTGVGDAVSGGVPYNPSVDDASVDINTILMALAGGTSVTITTNNAGGSQAGNIIFENSINATTAGNATLTLLADNNILLNGHSITSAGALNITMNAGGSILQTGGTLASAGGNINLRAQDMTLNGTINAGTGAVNLLGINGQTIALGGGAGALNLSAAELAGITAGILKIGNAASGAITIGGDITTAGASVLHLHTGGTITGTAGGIIAGQLALQSGGAITLTDSSTNVSTVAISAAGQTVGFTNAGAVSIGSVNGVLGVTAGNVTLNAGGAVTQTQSIAATALNVTAGGNVTLNNVANNAATILVNAGANSITYVDTNGFDIVGLTGGTVTLTGAGAITDSGAIIATNLNITNAGAVTLDSSTNNAATININAGANAITYRDTNGFDIAGLTGGVVTLTGAGAITDSGAIIATNLNITNAGAVTLDFATTDVDNLFVSAAGQTVSFTDADGINLAGITAGTFTLNAGGVVTDSLATVVTALNVTAAGNVTLDVATNNASTVNMNAGANGITYVDANGFDIAGLTGGTVTLTGAGAITDSGAIIATNLNITNTGAITLDFATTDVDNLFVSAAGQTVSFTDADGINLAGITSGTFTLNAGGAVTDSLATVVTTLLGITAGGNVTLDHASNNAATIAINAGVNDIVYRDVNAVDIGTVGSIVGLTGGNVSLQVGGALTDTQASTISGLLTVQAGTNAVTLDHAGNSFGGLSVLSASNLTVTNLNQLTLDATTLTGALVARANNGITVAGNVSAAGGVTLNADQDANGTGNLTVNATRALSSGNAAMTITANDLVVNGTISSGTGRTDILVSDGGTIDIGSGGAGAFNISSAEIAAITAGILKIGDASAGAITISSTITPAASTLYLHTGSTITGTAGGIVATSLALQAGGTINLSHASTNVTNLAASAAGQSVTIVETNGFNIGPVDTVTGMTANALNITTGGALTDSAATLVNNLTVQAGGAVTLDTATNNAATIAINAGSNAITYRDANGFDIAGLTGAAVTLTGAGAITDSGTITATGLSITNTGSITLDEAATDVDSLFISAAGQTVTFRDVDGIDLAGVTATNFTLNAGGAVTDSVATVVTSLNITAGDDVTLDTATNNAVTILINAGANDIIYRDTNGFDVAGLTAGTVTLTGAGTITDSGAIMATNLNITNSGTITLDVTTTDVDNLFVSASGQAVSFTDVDGINLAGITATTFTLNAGGAVTGSAAITGTSLAITAGGNVTLNTMANALANIAISAAGRDVLYRDTDGVNVAVVGAVSGITAASLGLQVNGNLADTGAAAFNIAGHTNIVSTAGTIALDNANNDFNTLSASHVGNITSIVDANALEITGITRTGGTGTASLSAASGMTVSGNISTGTLTLNADSNNDGTGTFTLNNSVAINSLSNAVVTISSGDLVLNGTINSGTGATAVQATGGNTIDLGNGGGGAYNISQTELNNITAGAIRVGGTASGALTVSSNISAANSTALRLHGAGITATAGAIIENSLAIYSSGAVNMTNTSNAVNTLAVSMTAAGQTASFYNSGNLALGAVDGTNGAAMSTNGILRLEVDGAVTDSQASSGLSLAVISTGNITLDNNNDFYNVAFYAPGRAVRYHDNVGGVAINTVSGVVGIEAASLNMTTTNAAITDSATGRSLISGLTTLSTGTGAITLDHASNDFNTLTITSAGAATVLDANSLTLNAVTTGGTTILRAVNGLTVDGNITSGGTLELNADSNNDNAGTLTINTTRAVSTAAANQTIALIGADLIINGTGSVNSGTANTRVRAAGGTSTINIAGAGGFSISQAEINAITAGVLHIQNGSSSGSIVVAGNITAANAGALYLQAANGGINASASAISVTNLALQATGTGNVNATNAGNNVTNLAIDIVNGTADFRTSGSINIASVAAINGLNTSLSAGVGRTVHIQAAGITDSVASSVNNFGFTSTGNVVMDEATNNFLVIAGNAAGHDVEISDVASTVIGQVTTLTPSTITGITANNLTLNSAVGGAIVDNNQSVISGNLIINAGTNAVTLDHALNNFGTVLIGSAGNTVIFDVNDVNVGLSNVNGTLDVRANNNITVTNNVTTSGNATFRADFDGNAAGTFTVDATRTVDTTGADLSITAADLALNGNLNSGAGDTTITVVGGRTIGVGDTVGDMTISKAELQRITAQNLRIGGNLVGDITVDNIAVADLANIAGSLYFLALGNGADIHLINNPSVFKTVYGEADDSIFVDKDLTATVGQISLRADVDGAADPDGDQIYVTDGINITSVGNSLFESTNGITIGQHINIFGSLVINADTDGDGVGVLTLLGGYSIATNNYDLSLIAGDFVLNGLIDAGTGRIQIETTNGRTIGVGNATGDARIDKTELQRLSAGTLYIGGVHTGNIMVDNVAPVDVAGISGAVTLAALGAGSHISFNNVASSFGNGLNLLANMDVILNRSVGANGPIVINTDYNADGVGNLTIAATRTLNSTNNDITITANDVGISGAINSGTGRTSLIASDNAAIDLGGAGGGFNLSSAELNNITAGILSIGSAAGGVITVSSDIAPANTGTLKLLSGGAITGTAGGITIQNLGLSAGGAITLTDANTNIGTIAASTTNGNITVYDANEITVGMVDNLSGLATASGNISLRMDDLDITHAINSGAGIVTFEGRNGETIGLGGAGGDLNLTAAELALITAGTLHIGTAGAGAVTVSADATLADVNHLSLQTGSGVTATAGGLVVSDLTIAAGGDVIFTDTSTNVDTLTVNAAGHHITFFDSTDLSAALTANSANISANNGLTLTSSLAANGAVILNADADNNGIGTFTLNGGLNISTNGNALDITTNDVVLQAGAALNSGAGTTRFLVTNGGQINLGGAGSNMNLSNAELASITANTLIFGNGTAGAITLHDVLTHNASVITLHSGSTITGAAGGVVVDRLNVTSGGTVDLTHASNDVNDLSVSAAGQTVSFRDSDGINLAGVTANGFTLTAGGAVTQTQAVVTNNLNVTAGGDVTLNNAANDTATIAINAGAHNITYRDASGFDIAGLTGNTISLTGAGAITDSGAITATNLNITNAGSITLDEAASDVDNLFIDAAGQTVSFRDADGINLAGVTTNGFTLNAGGAVTQTQAIAASDLNVTAGGDVTLNNATNDVDNLAVSALGHNVSFRDADGINLAGITASGFTLNAGGAVTQTQAIAASDLNVTAGGDVTLNNAGNDAATIAINAGAHNITYRDASGFDIAGLTGNTISLTGAGAITDSGAVMGTNLNITNAGSITLNEAASDVDNLFIDAAGQTVSFRDSDGINLAGVTANGFTLTAGGAVTQTQAITASDLNVTAGGDVTLANAANDAATIAINAGVHNITYRDASGFDITGLTGNAITLTGAGAITDSGAITATNLNITNAGSITLDDAASDVDNLFIDAAGQTVSFRDADGINLAGVTANGFNLTAGGAVTQTQAVVTNNLNVTAGGDVTLNNAANDAATILINAGAHNISYRDASGFDIAGLTGNAISLTGAGAITDSGAITGTNLNITNAGSITLDEAASDVDNLFIDAAGQTVSFRDSDGINLAGVTANGFTLTAGGAVTQTQAITASDLNVTAGGDVTLANAANDAATIAINAGVHNITYRDASGFDITGLTGNAITLTGAGAITDSGAITATNLNITNAGSITLDDAASDVDNLFIDAAGQTVSFRDADGINLAGVTANGFNLTAGGAVTDSLPSIVSGTTSISAGSANDITLDAAGNDFGTVSVTSGRNVLVNDINAVGLGASTISGTLAVNAASGVTVAGNVTTAGATSINADTDNDGIGTFTVSGGQSLNTGNAALSVTAADVALSGTINSGAGITSILATNGGTISLGGAGGDMAIDNAELNAITAATLRIGDATAGAITVVGDIAPTNVSTLHLRTGGSITATSGGITVSNLALDAGTGISVTDTSTAISTLAARSTTGPLNFINDGALSVGTVDGIAGIQVTGGNVTLEAADFEITQAINNAGGITALRGNPGGTISLGGAGGDVALSNAELNAITASTLRIGGVTAGNITVAGDITPANISTLHLRTGGSMTGTTGGIGVNSLAIDAANGITLTDTSTAVSNLAARTTSGNVDIVNSGTMSITTVDGLSGIQATGGNVTIRSTDLNILQTINNAGGITTLLGAAGGTISLGGAGGALSLSDTELDAITAAILRIGDETGGNITIAGDITPANVDTLHLRSGGSISGTAGGISIGNLALSAGGDINITDADTNVSVLAVTAPGRSVTIHDSNAISIGTVDGVFGITANGFTLNAGGAVTQTQAITASDLNVTAGGDVTLNNAGNDVDNLTVSALGHNVSFRDSDGINLAGVTANGFTLTAGGAVTQTQAVVTNNLNVTAGGDVTLNNAGNDAATIAINTAAHNISYRDASGFDIAGLTGNTISLTGAGAITDSGAVSATNLNITNAGSITLNEAASDVDALFIDAAGQTVSFRDADGINLAGITANGFTLTAGGAVTQTQAVVTNNLNVTAGGDVTLNNAANDAATILINAGAHNISYRDASGFDIAGLTGNAITLTGAGAITDSGAITGTNLNITNAGSITLDEAASDVDNLFIDAAGQTVSFRDADGINLAGVTANGFTLTAGGAVTQTQAVVTNNLNVAAGGDVTLNNAGNDVGSILINAGAHNITYRDASGFDIAGLTGNTISLTGAGAITDSGAVMGTNLNITNAGSITLNEAPSDVDNLFIDAAGQTVSFRDADGINLAGITANGFTLTAGGAVTQTQAVVTNNLNVTAGGDVTLNNAGNDVDNLAVSASGHNVSFRDSGGINLAGVTAGGFSLTAGGAVTDSLASIVSGTTSISAGSANDITLDAAGNDFGTVSVTSGRNVLVNDINAVGLGASTISGTLAVNAASGVTVAGNVTTAGATSINADTDNDGIGTFSVSGGQSLNTGNAALSVTAADVALSGTINSGAGITTLSASNNGTIGLGAAADMQISAVEAGNIMASLLRLGNAGTASIIIGDTMNFANVDTLHLHSAGGIGGVTGGIVVNNLALSAGGAVSMLPLSNNVTTIAISAPGQTVAYNDTNGFTVGAVDGVTGITGDAINLSSGGAITGAAAITGTDLSITSAGTVDLGTVTNSVTNLIVNAAGQNVVFRALNALNLAGLNAQNATIIANGAVNGTGALTVANDLSLTAGAANDIVLTHAGNNLSTVHIVSGRDVTIADNGNLSIGTSTVSGALSATAQNNLTIAGTVQVGGAANLVATPANNGLFIINGGASLNATGQNVTVTAYDANINGALSTGAGGSVAMRSNAGAAWGLGTAAGQFTLSGAELANITTGTMRVGGAGAGNILAQNVSQANSNGIGNMVLEAHGNQSYIQFGPGAVTFRGLIAEADAEIRVQGNLSAIAGNMILDGDYDNFFDVGYANNVVYGPGVQVFAQGALTVGGTTGSGVMQGDLTMSTGAGNMTLDNLNGPHNLNLIAGGAGDVIITGSIGGITPLNNVTLYGDGITGDIHAATLAIESNVAYLTGTVGGLSGEDAAGFVVLNRLLPGPYYMNGFIIEGYVPPPPAPPVNSGGSGDPTSMLAPWIESIPHGFEQRNNTTGDLLRQDVLRHSFVADILEFKDTVLSYSRDFLRLFFSGGAQKIEDVIVGDASGDEDEEEGDA